MDTGWPLPLLLPSCDPESLAGHLKEQTLPHSPVLQVQAAVRSGRAPCPQEDHKLQVLPCPRHLLPGVTEVIC